MQRIAASELIQAVAQRVGWNYLNLNQAQFEKIRNALSKSVRKIWEGAWFKDLTLTERRTLRPAYSGVTTYDPEAEVYDQASDAYYVALQETLGNPPTSLVSGTRITNSTYWAACALDVSAEDWVSGDTYQQEDQARHPDSGDVYQVHTGPTALAPTNPAAWGRVQAFDPYVPWRRPGETIIGEVREVYRFNPKSHLGECRIPWDPSPSGVQIPGLPVTRPWIEFRGRAPRIFGTFWDPLANYTPADDETGVGGGTSPTGPQQEVHLEFATVAQMLATASTSYRTATCWNFEDTDGVESGWTRTSQPGLVDNGNNIRQADDGAFVRRTYVILPDGP